MPYKLNYHAWVSWVPDGVMITAPSKVGQTVEMQSNDANSGYALVSSTFTNTDITNLLNGMKTDLTTQMTNLQTQIQGFASGGG